MNELFARLAAAGAGRGERGGFAPEAVKLTRLLDLRYPHQGYTLAGRVSGRRSPTTTSRGSSTPSTMLHRQVYGQSAPKEDAEIVTFRLQAEIEVPRLALPELAPRRRPRGARARRASGRCSTSTPTGSCSAKVYDRQKLMAGDRIAGPAIIDQFDATTVVLAGQTADRRRHRHPDHRDRRAP